MWFRAQAGLSSTEIEGSGRLSKWGYNRDEHMVQGGYKFTLHVPETLHAVGPYTEHQHTDRQGCPMQPCRGLHKQFPECIGISVAEQNMLISSQPCVKGCMPRCSPMRREKGFRV